MIETKVPGDPVSIRAAAGWLKVTLRGAVEAAANHDARARTYASSAWTGEAGEGYQAAAGQVLAATDGHVDRIGRAANALETLAAALTDLEEDMAEVRNRAAAHGLRVTGTTIHPAQQPSPMVLVPGATGPAAGGHDAAVAQAMTYAALAAEVAGRRADYDAFADSLLLGAREDAESTDDVTRLVDAFGDALDTVLSAVGPGLAGLGLTERGKTWRSLASQFRLANKRSGNPAVRAWTHSPSGRRIIDDMTRRSRYLTRAGKFMGPVGVGLTLVDAYREGSETGDWGRVGAKTGSGLVGGALAGVAISAAGGGPLLVVAAGAGVGLGVAWIGEQVYDQVTQDSDPGAPTAEPASTKRPQADGWEAAGTLDGQQWALVTPW